MEELAVAATSEPAHAELEELIRRVQAYNPQADVQLICRAYEYSARMHAEQKRESGEPYVTHPLAVALIIAQLKLDLPSIITGLLHDVVEDTMASLDEVRELFGSEVATLVDGVTKVSKITFSSRAEKQAENFRKMVIAMAHDIRVVLIKLADRLHNMRTLSHLARDRQEEISHETLEIYAPIAHRLGIYWLKSDLEDAAFRYTNPTAYATLKAHVARTMAESEDYIRAVIGIITQRLEEAGVKAEVTGRPKNIYSIHRKMQEEGLHFDQVYDLVAFRIIVATLRECYEALGVAHASWKPIPGRFKDYIALPKVNMYQSLHTTVIGPQGQRMEVQIRTAEMHKVAEEGIAAHWSYKEGGTSELRETERFAWLRRLIEWQQNLKDPQEFLSTVKDDLFPEEVFVFTPKGDVLDFPQGATVIDFAYRIHSQVGQHLSAARANGRMVPLRYRMKSGDTIEVVTSDRQSPGKDWMSFAVTARAKSRIRQWLRAQQAERSIKWGITLIDRELEPLGLTVAQLRPGKRFRAGTQGVLLSGYRQPAGRGRLRDHHRRPIAGQAPDARRTQALPRREGASAAGVLRQRPPGARNAPPPERQRGHRLGGGRHAGAVCAVLQSAAGRGDRRLHHAWPRRHGASEGMFACDGERSAAPRAGGMEGRRGHSAADSARGLEHRPARTAGRDVQDHRDGRG